MKTILNAFIFAALIRPLHSGEGIEPANPTPPNQIGSTNIEAQVHEPGAGGTAAPLYTGKPGAEAGQPCVNPQDQAVMMWIPAGEFLMGRKDGSEDSDERPQRKVYLDGYWMYKNSVTVGQYRKFCEATKHAMPPEPSWKWQDDNPVVSVSWDDAVAYTKWAGMALPMEAQWEKAARGTEGRIYPWGNDWDASKCVNGFNSGQRTQPVGSIAADISPYGCLEMVGNVWQWCADWYYDSLMKIISCDT